MTSRLPSINWKLLPLKIHYGFNNAGTAPFLIFGATIVRQLGYSAFIVGVIFMALPAIGMLANILSCAFADKYKKRRTIFLSSILIALLNIVLFQYVVETPTTVVGNINFTCNYETFFFTCDTKISNNALDRLLSSLGQNGTIRCEMECYDQDGLSKEICSSWKMEQYCYNQTNNFQSEKSLKTPNNSNSYYNRPTIEFEAIVPVNHIHVTRDVFNDNDRCLYSRVVEVVSKEGGRTFGRARVPSCEGKISTTCSIRCNDNKMMNMINGFDASNVFTRLHFWLLFLTLAINWISLVVNASVSDTICYDLIGNRPDLYGNQRLYGAIGFGLMSVLCGLLVDFYSDDNYVKNYKPAYYISIAMFVWDFFTCLKVKVEQKTMSNSIFGDMGKIFRNKPIVIFAIWCFYIGVTTMVIYQYLFLHIEYIAKPEQHAMIKTLEGCASFVCAVVGEAPLFVFAGRIIRKLGHVQCMSVILFGMLIRLTGYAIMNHPSWILLTEVMHGFTFGLFYSVMTSYADLISLPGTETTSQGVFASIFALGNAFGSLIGGVLFDSYDGTILYTTFAFVTLILFLLHICVRRYTNLKDMEIQQDFENKFLRNTSSVENMQILKITPDEGDELMENFNSVPTNGLRTKDVES